MTLYSAGLLPYTCDEGALRVFIVHMGGPFWGHRDQGGGPGQGHVRPREESPTDAARREFHEEVGVPAPPGELIDLGEVRLSSGKRVRGYGVEASLDLAFVSSNTFEVEWPRKSGKMRTYPEVDRAGWFDLEAGPHPPHPGSGPVPGPPEGRPDPHRLTHPPPPPRRGLRLTPPRTSS